jgi:O-antigen ligase
MENKRVLSIWYSGYLAFLLVVFLVLPKLTAFAIILFFPLAVIGLRKHYFQIKINRLAIMFFIAFGFYLMYCLFTRHPEIAIKSLEYKLSFLLIPLLFSFVPKEKMNVQLPIIGFLMGTIVLSINGVMHSMSCYATNPSIFACFTSSNFSPIHHPSYATVFYTVALFLVWFAYKSHYKWMKLWLALLLSGCYLLAIVFCFSLAGLLFFFLAVTITLSVLIYKKWGRAVTFILGVITTASIVVLFQSVSVLKNEFNGAKQYFDEYIDNPKAFVQNKKYPMSGSEVRLVMWTAAYKAFTNYPLGVGTGNTEEVLTTQLTNMNQKELAKQQLNPHNQYLQTGLEIGLIGLVAILAPFLFALQYFNRSKNWLLLLVVGSLLFNMLFESMLQRRSGIVFYTIATCMLVCYSENKKNAGNEQLEQTGIV